MPVPTPPVKRPEIRTTSTKPAKGVRTLKNRVQDNLPLETVVGLLSITGGTK